MLSAIRTFALVPALLLIAAPVQAQHLISSLDAEQLARQSMPEYFEFLSLPADAVKPEDIQRNAGWLEQAFQKRGFVTRQLANEGRPLVFAEYGKPVKGRKTILFYMHFDAQPVTPAEWKSDPWKPVLKARDAAGAWQELPGERLQQGRIDPEWRVFARAAADDKGPIMMFLAAMDGLRAVKQKPAVNIKVILDSQEEKGSPRLHIVMQENEALLKSDGLIVYDGAMPSSNQPGVNFGNRGSIQLDLTVFGASSAPHSGTYGNVIPNPALRLATLLASMKDAEGKVRIAGFYDGVKISAEDRQGMAVIAPPAGTLEKRFGVAKLDGLAAATNPVEAVQYPSLDILGLEAARVGSRAANAIPSQAMASLNIRTVPEIAPKDMFGLVRQYIEAQGFHLIEGEVPTAEERARHERLARLSLVAYPSTASAARVAMDSPLAKWVLAGVAAPRKQEPEKIRMGGSTLPMSGAVDVLKMSYVVVPLVNADNNQHSFDENLRLGNYLEGIRSIASMLTTPSF
ncbi:M20/M25/M40 family metallo-hydrolase [Uliginosibacterium aquaticum]|uniref:M20/M25/M40 family metallo-hydrolase n=1 Tax=Uliginosibacterium aquaticum TaxID=2731212 RepID=A0ABX2IGM2_9RHOO|nr:M20/M25/M40 family metallo-hydrolase [Uliginosibacterium aquaticum]NSL55652.1 M20/M25/M40 family metallo-hydrolase [Uliginosibacterium aquaticum]